MSDRHNRRGAIPVLRTERLVLRAHALSDFADCLAMWSDPAVTRYIGGRPFNGEEVWARLLRYSGHWQLLGYGYWLVADRASGGFVGEVGFADFRRQITPSFDANPEIGWALAPASHGQGLALEAVQAALHWADREYPADRTFCIIHPDNVRSIKLAEKAGYQEFARTLYKEQPTIIYRRFR